MKEDPLGIHTCHYYLKHPPRQIDFMCSDLPAAARAECHLHQSDATVTDHRALLSSITARQESKIRFLNYGGFPAQSSETRASKPVGWKPHDPGYNDLVRQRLGLPSMGDALSTPSEAIHLFTDGSCILKRRKAVTAGWGFVLFPHGPTPLSGETLR
jgi:hypothetical protein